MLGILSDFFIRRKMRIRAATSKSLELLRCSQSYRSNSPIGGHRHGLRIGQIPAKTMIAGPEPL